MPSHETNQCQGSRFINNISVLVLACVWMTNQSLALICLMRWHWPAPIIHVIRCLVPQLTCQFHNPLPRHPPSLAPVNVPAPTSHRRADAPAPAHRCASALMPLNHPFPPSPPSLEPTNRHPSTAPVPFAFSAPPPAPLLWPAHPNATPTIFATSLLPVARCT
jgi:hypothetical protein